MYPWSASSDYLPIPSFLSCWNKSFFPAPPSHSTTLNQSRRQSQFPHRQPHLLTEIQLPMYKQTLSRESGISSVKEFGLCSINACTVLRLLTRLTLGAPRLITPALSRMSPKRRVPRSMDPLPRHYDNAASPSSVGIVPLHL